MKYKEEIAFILDDFEKNGNPDTLQSMQRFGIQYKKAFGLSIPFLRSYAKSIGKNHELGQELWKTGIHEALLLAIFISDKKKITQAQMESWVKDFYSWDICDQACGNLFDKTPWAYERAMAWSKRKPEFEKRAGFSMMASLAVHDKKAGDEKFIPFFKYIEKAANDNRNFVKKAVNWALRGIGKRNGNLKKEAMLIAQCILKQGTPSATWIARDALRELARK